MYVIHTANTEETLIMVVFNKTMLYALQVKGRLLRCVVLRNILRSVLIR
jgi:hypothetical protein